MIKFYNIFENLCDIRWKYFEIAVFLLLYFFLIVHPSIILRLILKIKRNYFLDVLVISQFTRKDYFSNRVFSILNSWGHQGGGVRVSKVTTLPLHCNSLVHFAASLLFSFLVLVFLFHNRECLILHTVDQAVLGSGRG